MSSSRPSGYRLNASSGPRSVALLFSLALTAGLLSLLVLVSHARPDRDPSVETLVLLTAAQIPSAVPDPPTEENIDQPEILADSFEEAAPQSRPRTISPPPVLPVVPPAAIKLAPIKLTPIELPAIPRTGYRPLSIPGADSRGDQASGPTGIAGAGGKGVSGNGSGGAGNGEGRGSRLIASWAPSMDFSRNSRVYPPAARKAKIEGSAYLKCFVLRRDRVRDCNLVSEKPQGHGFGKAALKTEPWMRIRVHNQAGRRMYNEWIVVETNFELPADEKEEGKDEDPPASPTNKTAP